MLNEVGEGEGAGEGAKEVGQFFSRCVCSFHTIAMTSSFSSSSKDPGLLTGRWANGQMASPACLSLAALWRVEGPCPPGGQPGPPGGAHRLQGVPLATQTDLLGVQTGTAVVASVPALTLGKQTGKDCLVWGCCHIQNMPKRKRNKSNYVSLSKCLCN